MPTEAVLARTLLELADSLVEDFDVVDLLTLLANRCVEVLDVTAAGVMLGSPGGDLRVIASSSDVMHVLELFEEQIDEGPCQDCYRTGEAVVNHVFAASGDRWPRFASRALEAGFRSAYALPMHLRVLTIGALNLFRTGEDEMAEVDVLVAQAFADVATIAIVQNRTAIEAKVVNEQLTHALTTRIVIEQAKGMVAEQAGVDMERSFSRLRNHARNHNLRLVDVARDVIDGRLAATDLAP